MGLQQALKDANDQCVLLFNEVQKAWKVSFTLQSDLKVSFHKSYLMSVCVCYGSFILNSQSLLKFRRHISS